MRKSKETTLRQSSLQPQSELRERAFTLIEVSIAILILGLILTVAYSSLGQIIRSKQFLDDKRDGTVIANSILIRITREFQLMHFQPGTTIILPEDTPAERQQSVGALDAQEHSMDGRRSDSIMFLALEGGQYLPDGGTHSGIVQISYHVEKNAPGNGFGRRNTQSLANTNEWYLVREEIPYIRPAEEAYKKLISFPVTSHLYSIAFEYFDAEKEEWVTSWGEDRRGRAPRLLRFTLQTLSPKGILDTFSTMVPLQSSMR